MISWGKTSARPTLIQFALMAISGMPTPVTPIRMATAGSTIAAAKFHVHRATRKLPLNTMSTVTEKENHNGTFYQGRQGYLQRG